MEKHLETKYADAVKIVQACFGTGGVWASTDRYRNQCWTRDFLLAVLPALGAVPGGPEAALRHMQHLVERIPASGKVPILFLDDEVAFLRQKARQWREKKGVIPFMLARYLDDPESGLADLTPATRDNNCLFIATAGGVGDGDENTLYMLRDGIGAIGGLTDVVERTAAYVEGLLVTDAGGLVPGPDWRDTRDDLEGKCVLTNACLLRRAYLARSKGVDAARVADIIQARLWLPGGQLFFDDYEGAQSFDLLGNALAILDDIATATQADAIIRYALNVRGTPFGFKLADTFLPPRTTEEACVMARDGAVVWPWISGYMLLAMIHTRRWDKEAIAMHAAWTHNHGFYEWYDIIHGHGYGSADQLWSAALYIRVTNALTNCGALRYTSGSRMRCVPEA